MKTALKEKGTNNIRLPSELTQVLMGPSSQVLQTNILDLRSYKFKIRTCRRRANKTWRGWGVELGSTAKQLKLVVRTATTISCFRYPSQCPIAKLWIACTIIDWQFVMYWPIANKLLLIHQCKVKWKRGLTAVLWTLCVLYSQMSPIAIQWRIQNLSLWERAGYLPKYGGRTPGPLP